MHTSLCTLETGICDKDFQPAPQMFNNNSRSTEINCIWYISYKATHIIYEHKYLLILQTPQQQNLNDILQMSGADPGFEVRGGANGLEKSKSVRGGGGGGGGGGVLYRYIWNAIIKVYIFQWDVYVKYAFYYNIVYLKPLIQYCNKKIYFEKI